MLSHAFATNNVSARICNCEAAKRTQSEIRYSFIYLIYLSYEPTWVCQKKIFTFRWAFQRSLENCKQIPSHRMSELTLLFEEHIGIKICRPTSWFRWTSEEFREQGGVYCFTPHEQIEQPTTAISLLLCPETEGLRLNEYTRVSIGQLEIMFKSQGGQTSLSVHAVVRAACARVCV